MVDRPCTAYELLGGSWPTGLSDAGLPPGWLADLQAPRLVITPDYVGPPRRRDDHGPPRAVSASWEPVEPGARQGPQPSGGASGHGDGRVLHVRHLVMVALATAAAAVPLTLLAERLL